MSAEFATVADTTEMIRASTEMIRVSNESFQKMFSETISETISKMIAGLREENSRTIADLREENSRTIADLREENSKTIADLGRKIDAVNENVGGLAKSVGNLVESMVEGGLVEQFQKLGYRFTKYTRGTTFDDPVLKINLEIDFLLENGDTVLVVEVKTKLTRDHVNKFVKNLDKYQHYAYAHGDARHIVAAVAGGYVPEKVGIYAHSKGLYVICVYSDTMTKLLETPEGFEPACW